MATRVDAALTARVRDAAERRGHRGAFNPSPAVLGDRIAVSYRALPDGASKPFHAFVASGPLAGGDPLDVLDLTALAAERGLGTVADPKLLELHGELHVTWNSGHVSTGRNSIHLLRLGGAGEAPGIAQRCELVEPRQAVEKNWAFAAAPDGGVRGLYGVSPLAELRLVDGALGSSEALRFAIDERSGGLRGITIGTQLLEDERGLLLVGHEKRQVAGKRAYFGRLVRIRDPWTPAARAEASGARLVHSIAAALPRRGAHNPNLLSATYFSGASRDGGRLVLGYGINDTALAIARAEEVDLWQ